MFLPPSSRLVLPLTAGKPLSIAGVLSYTHRHLEDYDIALIVDKQSATFEASEMPIGHREFNLEVQGLCANESGDAEAAQYSDYDMLHFKVESTPSITDRRFCI